MFGRLSISSTVALKRASALAFPSRSLHSGSALWVSTTAIPAEYQSPPPSRTTVKPIDTRKTYLVDTYSHLLKNNSIILVLHHNNLLKSDNENLRGLIKKAGGRLTVTRSRVFKIALRGMDHEDPASKDAQLTRKSFKHPLAPLFSGPSAIITLPDVDPKKVESVIKVLDKSKGNLTLLGSLINNEVLSVPEVNKFKLLPTLPELRSQLVGVLSILGGAGLVQTLEASSKVLYLTMDERRKQLDPSEEKKDEEKRDEDVKE